MELDPKVSAVVFPPPKHVAVIGLSGDPNRPSHEVARTLQYGGYKVYPVRPGAGEILGEKSYGTVAAIPPDIDVVVVFRRSEKVSEHLDDILAKRPRVLWLPDGVINEAVASRARAAGVLVVQNDCMARRFNEWRTSHA